MSDLIDQQEFEAKVYGRVRQGDISKMAARTGRYRTTLQREFDPDEPMPSTPYKLCVELNAWEEQNREVYEDLHAALLDFIVSRRVASSDGASADAQALGAFCQQFIGLLLSQGGEDELRAVARNLYAVSGAYLKPSIEEVRRRVFPSVSSAGEARR